MKNNRRGIALIELLVTMAFLILLLGMLTLLINRTMQAQSIQMESYDRLQFSHALADEFRRDVARAEKAPENWRDHVAGAEVLILQLKNDEHVIYEWKNDKLRRLVFKKDVESERRILVAARTIVEFVPAGLSDKVVRLRLVPVRNGKALAGQAVETAAALGGDWR